MNRRDLMAAGAATFAATAMQWAAPAFAQGDAKSYTVRLGRVSGPLDHIWSKSVGSDRAAITLREDWRKDLRRFHNEAGIERVRMHGIFCDELGVYAPSIMSRKKEWNWQNIDRVYDGLLESGVRPIVELSFMPAHLASGKAVFGFYNANITPPKDMAEWGAFIKAFVEHLVARYSLEEVRQWAFEVWNEPDLGFFWTGTKDQYFELYKTSAVAIKSVDEKLKVGGPATSGIHWIEDFLAYCDTNNVPVDFVATHMYIGDNQKKTFGEGADFALSDIIPEAMRKVRGQIDATRFKGIPLWLTEWSCDSPAMTAHVIKACMGTTQLMSHWTVSNTYEELGVANYVLKEGSNGFGMMAVGSIPKPQFNTYKLLHKLGNEQLEADEGPLLASRRKDGSYAVAVWNLAEVPQPGGIPGAAWERKVAGAPKQVRLVLEGARSGQKVKISYVDYERGSPYPMWRKLGSPQYPTIAQMDTIRKAAELAEPETRKLGKEKELVLDLPPECLALIEI
jgi:xylan 1,4-beta-xylosidase